jgi:hypothetical protein
VKQYRVRKDATLREPVEKTRSEICPGRGKGIVPRKEFFDIFRSERTRLPTPKIADTEILNKKATGNHRWLLN